MIVIAGELTLGVLQGIALGIVLSMVTLIYLTSHPQGAELGQLPSTEAYRDVQLHPDAIRFPGLLIWRIGGDLFFASIGHTSAKLKISLASRPDVKRLLLDFAPVNFIDTREDRGGIDCQLYFRAAALTDVRCRATIMRSKDLGSIRQNHETESTRLRVSPRQETASRRRCGETLAGAVTTQLCRSVGQ
jgi:MFS superfamily sulfate permease-like transporter